MPLIGKCKKHPLPCGQRFISARAIVDQYERAKKDILTNTQTAAVWAPMLQHLGPALLMEAKHALTYGESMVARWLAARAFQTKRNKKQLSAKVAKHFNRSRDHTSHGQRIDREEARSLGLEVFDIEPHARLMGVLRIANQ